MDAADLGDVLAKVALDAGLESDRRGRATDAGAVHADLDDVVGGERNELDIAAVGLDRGADEIQHFLDTVEHGMTGAGLSGSGRGLGRGRDRLGWVEAGQDKR